MTFIDLFSNGLAIINVVGIMCRHEKSTDADYKLILNTSNSKKKMYSIFCISMGFAVYRQRI